MKSLKPITNGSTSDWTIKARRAFTATREEAIKAAKRMLKDEGGGELYIKNDDGSVLAKVYVEPNNLGDPGE